MPAKDEITTPVEIKHGIQLKNIYITPNKRQKIPSEINTPPRSPLTKKIIQGQKVMKGKNFFFSYIKQLIKNFFGINEKAILESLAYLSKLKTNGKYLTTYEDANDIYRCLNENNKVLLEDKAIVLALLRENGQLYPNLVNINFELKSDKDVILTAVRERGVILEHAKAWNNDKEVVRAAVQQNYRAYRYVGNKLIQEINFTMEISKTDKRALQYIPIKFKNTISQLLKSDPSVVKYLSQEVILDFIKEDAFLNIIREYPPELLKNKNFLIQAIKQNCNFFDLISDEIKNDARFIKNLLDNPANKKSDSEIPENKDKESDSKITENIVLKIIAQKNPFLDIVKKTHPELLFKDAVFITKAIKQNYNFFDSISDETKNDAEFINSLINNFLNDKEADQNIVLKILVKVDIKVSKSIVERMSDDNILKLTKLDFISKINKNTLLKNIFDGSILNFLNEKQKNNKKIIFELFNIGEFGGHAFMRFASDSIKKDYQAVGEFIKQALNGSSILNQLNKAYILEVIKVNHEIYRLLPKAYLQDKEYLLNILMENSKIYPLLSKAQQADKEFIIVATKKDPAIFAQVIDVLYAHKPIDDKINEKLVCELLYHSPSSYNYIPRLYRRDEFFIAALDSDASIYLNGVNNKNLNFTKYFIKKLITEGHNPRILSYLDPTIAKATILFLISKGVKVNDKILDISLPLLLFIKDDLRKDIDFITDVLHREATYLSEKNQNQRFPFDLPKDIEFFGVHESLKSKEFISKLINQNRLHCESILQTITSKNLLLDLMKDNVANGYRTLMCYLGSHWRSNQEFILEAFKIEGNEIFEFIKQGLKRNKDFIAKLCVINANILEKIDESLINDKEFMFFLLQKNRNVSQYLNEKILFEIISNPFNFSFLSKELRSNLIERIKESNEFCQKWRDVNFFDVSISKLKNDLINQLRSVSDSIRKLKDDPEVISAKARKLIGKSITELAQGSFLAREILRHPQAYGMRNKLSDYLVNQLLTSKELSGEVELVEKIINEIIRALFLQLRENEEYINKMPRRIKVSELGEFWQEWHNLDLPIKKAIAFDNKKNDQNEPINITIKNKTERCDLDSELGKFILQLVQNNFNNDIEKNALRLFHQIDHVVIFTRGTEEQSALLVFNSNNEGTSNIIEIITSGLNDGTRKNIKTTAIIGEDGTKKIVRSMELSGHCVADYDRNLFANNVALRIFLPGLKKLGLVENYYKNPCNYYAETNKGLIETAKRFTATPK